jgi:hypothetical protein
MKNKLSVITFPRREWSDVKARLDEGKIVYTIRVSDECEKYKKGNIFETEWHSKIKIISVKKIKNGIKELERQYPYFGELTKEMINELIDFDKMEIISLKSL